MLKIIIFFALILLGVLFFYLHASSSWMDEAGALHEPFFILVPLAYLSLALGLLGAGIMGMIALARRVRAKRTLDG